MTRFALLLLLLPLAACATTEAGRVAPPPLATPLPRAGLEGVMGQNAAALVRLLGQPDADVREGTARKLQFESPICVLDAYLYPSGKDEPKVTWVDARERDGSAIDRASCVAALTRREGGK